MSGEVGVRTIARYHPTIAGKVGAFHPIHIPIDLSVVFPWSVLGLISAALLCSVGFGPEMADLLAESG